MSVNAESRVSSAPASTWVRRFVPLIRRGGRVLDLAAGGVLIYETFARGNERFGRPHNPDFLLCPGELLEAFAMLTVVAFEQGEISVPRPAVIQRITAIAGPVGHLPEPVGLDIGQLRE